MTRRQSEPEPLSPAAESALDAGLASAARGEIASFDLDKLKPFKPNPMRDALAAQSKLDRINKRESDALANMKARYQSERNDVHAGLSDAVRRILEAAAEDGAET